MRTAFRPIALSALAVTVLAACSSGPPPSPSEARSAPPATPSSRALPRFELATYQYAIQTKGKLRVGIRDDDPTFASKDAAGKYAGFDANVARELAKAIFGRASEADPDAYITWVPVVSATRISALTDDKADVVVATFEINDQRLREIDFSSVYFRTGERILVKKPAAIASVSDLDQSTVCALRGSPMEQNIRSRATDAKIISLDTYDACLDALRIGAADAVWAVETTLFGLVRKDAGMKIVGGYLSDVPLGIGARKGRVGFVPFLNTAIADVIADGRWATLYKEWITPVSGDIKDGPQDKGRPAS